MPQATSKATSKANVEEVVEEVEDVRRSVEITATIADVQLRTAKGSESQNETRLSVVLEGEEFESVKQTTGEVIMTNAFGMDIYTLVNECAKYCAPLRIAKIKALGKRVNPELIALCLTGAKVKVTRTEVLQGDLRADGKPALQDYWVTHINALAPDLNDSFILDEIRRLLTTQPAMITDRIKQSEKPSVEKTATTF